jgi:hypothetical protein
VFLLEEMAMSIQTRLRKVEAAASKLRPRQQMISCEGMEWEAVVNRAAEAIDDADVDVLERILDHVAEANRTPRYNRASPNDPLRDEAGEIVYESHFFSRWLAGLQDGSFGLPPRVPRQLLESFDRRYGAVLFRCCDCRCGCGNAQKLEACPICGGELERMSLASELPHWESEGEFLARTRKRVQ